MMTLLIKAFVLLCLCVLPLLARALRLYWRLRGIPGPLAASMTDLWRFRIQYSRPILPVLLDLHARYGAVVRIGPNKVSVSVARQVRRIYGRNGTFTKVGTSCAITL